MRIFSPAGFGRFGAILAFGLVFAGAIGTRQVVADDTACCGCSSIFGACCDPVPRDPWYVRADALAWERLSSGNDTFAMQGLSPNGTVALSKHDMDDPFQAGIQILVGHNFVDTRYQVEVSYFWLNPLDTSAHTVDPTGNLYSPFTNFGATVDPSVDNNSYVGIHMISRLEGGEVNLKYQLPLPAGDPTIELMFGVRHLELREDSDYSSVPTTNVNPVTVRAHTDNNLWGPQIGALIDYGCNGVWLRVEGKAAICNNDASRDLEATINGADATHPRLTETTTSMVADIHATILWRITSALQANIGYQALWCDQLAVAASNLNADVPTLTDAAAQPPIIRRSVIYHGPFAGLQVSW